LTSRRRLQAGIEHFPLTKPFTISRSTVSDVEVAVVRLEDEHGHRGWGEERIYSRYGESAESVIGAIETARALVEGGCGRAALVDAMPGGAARTALDSALLDLEAKASGRTVHELLGLPPPQPALVTYTIGLGTPEAMAADAEAAGRPLLKLKLGGEGDLERVRAVHRAVPEARLIVDANEAWTLAMVKEWGAPMAELGVELIEQPLHADHDDGLAGIERPVPLCADESCHGADSLERLVGRYDMINIKLHKAGGLTTALRLADAAEARGLGIMVVCMMATSLAMAPAFVLSARTRYLDLDAPLLLARDREPPIRYAGAMMQPPPVALWG
jgi:L-alanine-DL-glutamate epimerase-like enolase superfamily enzyme